MSFAHIEPIVLAKRSIFLSLLQYFSEYPYGDRTEKYHKIQDCAGVFNSSIYLETKQQPVSKVWKIRMIRICSMKFEKVVRNSSYIIFNCFCQLNSEKCSGLTEVYKSWYWFFEAIEKWKELLHKN